MPKNPDFNVMLAKDYDPKRVKDWSKMTIEPKHDGVRVLIWHAGAFGCTYYSRNGRELEMFHHIDGAAGVVARHLHKVFDWGSRGGVILDGEMVALTKKFGDISGAIHRKGVTELRHAVFRCFGALSWEDLSSNGKCEYTQREVLTELYDVTERKRTQEIIVTMPTKVIAHEQVESTYARFRKDGHEGAMVKDLSQPWTAGRSYAWMKMKAEITVDVPILDFKPGKGKYQGTLGALIINHKGVPVPISGMDDALRRDLWRNRRKYRGRMVEVACQEVTERGSLRHPRFVRLRPDKD
jgi:ATP-dependent DNA ligase